MPGTNMRIGARLFQRVKNWVHPDTTRSIDAQKFREVYEALADEDTRRQYDATLKSQPAPVHISSVTDQIIQRTSTIEAMRHLESFMDEFFEGFMPGFFHKERYRPPKKDLCYEIILSSSEAMKGGLSPIKVPVIESCPQCHPKGFLGSFHCHRG